MTHSDFKIGDRIRYNEKTGIVTRTNILGMKVSSSIEVKMDGENTKVILSTINLQNVHDEAEDAHAN